MNLIQERLTSLSIDMAQSMDRSALHCKDNGASVHPITITYIFGKVLETLTMVDNHIIFIENAFNIPDQVNGGLKRSLQLQIQTMYSYY